jgi:hypothetical protein
MGGASARRGRIGLCLGSGRCLRRLGEPSLCRKDTCQQKSLIRLARHSMRLLGNRLSKMNLRCGYGEDAVRIWTGSVVCRQPHPSNVNGNGSSDRRFLAWTVEGLTAAYPRSRRWSLSRVEHGGVSMVPRSCETSASRPLALDAQADLAHAHRLNGMLLALAVVGGLSH